MKPFVGFSITFKKFLKHDQNVSYSNNTGIIEDKTKFLAAVCKLHYVT